MKSEVLCEPEKADQISGHPAYSHERHSGMAPETQARNR